MLYVRGEDYDLVDKSFISWKAFAAQNERTKQLIHFEAIPSIVPPKRTKFERPSIHWIRRVIIVALVILLIAALTGVFSGRFDKNNSNSPYSVLEKQSGTAGAVYGGAGGAFVPFGGGGGGGGDEDGGGGGGGDE